MKKGPTRPRLLVKRGIDIAGSVLLLALASPLLAGVSAAILVDAGRPVFFRQRRIGLRGRPFMIRKFRTLREEPHDPAQPLQAVTRTGRWLRKTGLDELPQLINVLKGEMSLVGPRATIPEQVARYTEHERKRLRMRPGITGWAQVQGRNLLPWPERIEKDIWYIEHYSLMLDIKVLARTPAAALSGTGAYGREDINEDFADGMESGKKQAHL